MGDVLETDHCPESWGDESQDRSGREDPLQKGHIPKGLREEQRRVSEKKMVPFGEERDLNLKLVFGLSQGPLKDGERVVWEGKMDIDLFGLTRSESP